MNELTCPHCRSNIPYGAKVCKGCQAEIDYGTPPFAYLVLIAASIYAGMKTSSILSGNLSFISWGVGMAVFVGGIILLTKIFKNRVNFSREYKTK